MRRLGVHEAVLFEGDWLPLVGVPVAEAKALLKDAANISYFADAFVNGRRVTVGYFLQRGDQLEFLQRFGFKAGDDLGAEKEMAQALLRAEPGLARLVQEVLALPLSAEDRLLVMTLKVVQWMGQRFGPMLADEVAKCNDIALSLNSIAGEWKRLAGKKTSSTSSAVPGELPTIRVSDAGDEVVVNGVHYAIDRTQAAILSSLTESHGGWVSAKEMRASKSILENEERIDRLMNTLLDRIPNLKQMVESRRGTGYRLRRPRP